MKAKHTTRYDDHVYSASGISADLEQQKRDRPWHIRLGSREDWIAGGLIALLFVLILIALANLVEIAVA